MIKIISHALGLISIFTAFAAQARELPLWEAGAGIGYVDFPDYRGSDERHRYVLPVPYLVYRGDFLKIDREKVRGLFFKNAYAELDMSLSASVPVKSSDNQARQGMPDLDPTLEIGPSLNFFLLHSEAKETYLDLRLPLRPVIATDLSHTHYIGYVFQPQLNVDVRDLGGHQGLNLGLAAGPIFGDKRYHDYFYGVSSAYATPTRPAYQARGGYAGSQFIAALSKRYPKYWVGGFLKWDTVHGAVFEDSPLVRRTQNLTGGFAVSWIFGESKDRVQEDR